MTLDTDCAVCLVDHDEELHEATLRVRRWYGGQVTLGFYEDVEQGPDTEAA